MFLSALILAPRFRHFLSRTSVLPIMVLCCGLLSAGRGGAQTTLTATALGGTATTVPSGTVVTFTANVVNGASPVSSGRVDLCDAAAAHCMDIHLLGTAQLSSSGTASFRLVPGVGAHSYKAVFRGTSAAASSASAVLSLTVSANPATVIRTSTALGATGSAGNYTLTGTVTALGSGNSAPTGTVDFVDVTNGNATLGSATLSGSTQQPFSLLSAAAPSPMAGAVASGDFNHDGHADLASFDASGNLNVALGNGDGSFQLLATSRPFAYTYISALVTGDFNADGKLDLAITSSGTTLTILTGVGDGTFLAGASVAVQSLGSMAAGDFNRDGRLDLAVSNAQSNYVSILPGNGNGTFSAATTISTAQGPGSIATADFDGDGSLDFAVLTSSNYAVTVYRGDGQGGFTPVSTSAYTGFDLANIATADWNGDGVPDLVVSGMSYVPISLIGNGDGTFQTAPWSVQGDLALMGAMAITDFNRDGNADVIALNSNSNSATGPCVFLGNGDGTFTKAGPFPGQWSDSLAVADFNDDGTPDVVFSSGYASSSSAMTLLLGETGLSASATATGLSPMGAGLHQVMAVYRGTAGYAGSQSSTTPLNGAKITPALAISATPSSSVYGQQVVLAATLSPYAEQNLSTNGEPVVFWSGTLNLGSASLSSGVAMLNVTALPAGANSVTASYGGDASFNAVSSPAVAIVTSKGTPQITWNPAATAVYTGKPLGSLLNATSPVTGTFAYTASLNGGPAAAVSSASVLGAGTYTLTATFTPSDTTNYTNASSSAPYVVTPAPLTVVPVNVSRPYGAANPDLTGTVTGALNNDTFTVAGSTTATAASAVGVYPITYTVSGANLANYTVTPQNGTLTVTKAAPAITWNTPAPILYGTTLGSAQLNASASVPGTFLYTPAAGTLLGAGTQGLSVVFTPTDQANYAASSAKVSIVVGRAGTSTTLALSNQNLTLAATVSAQTAGTPTGNVEFYSGTTVLGTGVLTNGVASLTVSSLPTGNAILRAQYDGDINFLSSTTTAAPVLAVGASNSSMTASGSGSASTSLTLGVLPGYAGTVQFSCSGLPANAACSFQPSSLVLDGTKTSASVVLTVQTGRSQTAFATPGLEIGKNAPLWAFAVPGVLLACCSRRRRQGLGRLAMLLVVCGILGGVVGCGGHDSSSSTTTTTTSTPSGTTNFQVIAAGTNGLTQSTTITLTVQ